MSSFTIRNPISVTQSISSDKEIAVVTSKPSAIRLHAHTEALENSVISKSSPQISESSNSSPKKRGSIPTEIISVVPSSLKNIGRKSQRRFDTLPLPLRANTNTKIETIENKESPKGPGQIFSRDSIWSISGVKLDRNFYKSLLKKPNKKQSKEFSENKINKSSSIRESEKEIRSKHPISRTFSEPGMTGKSKFYLEHIEYLTKGTFPKIVASGQEKLTNKKERFLKKKTKSAFLIPERSSGKIETKIPHIPISIKLKENQSASSDELNAFSPSVLRRDGIEVTERFKHTIQRSTNMEDINKSTLARTPSTSSAGKKVPSKSYSRQPKIGSFTQSHQVKIHKLEREPIRRSRNVNSDFRFSSGDTSVKDHELGDDLEHNFIKDLTTFSRLKNMPPSLLSSPSLKKDKIHKVAKKNDQVQNSDNMLSRKKAEQFLTNGIGTGTITCVESCITTSPISGERSILSDSGYSVTSNEPLLTDTGYVVLDSVGTASQIIFSSSVSKDPEGVNNVNAGYIHSPLQGNKAHNPHMPDVAPEKIHSIGINYETDSKIKANTSENHFDIYFNTYPQTKSLKILTDPFIINDQATGASNILSLHLPAIPFSENISRNKNHNLGFSKEDFETIKHRAKSVELFLTKKSKLQKPFKKRACSISRERSLITIITRTEEVIYPRSEINLLNKKINQKQSETFIKSVHFSQKPYVSTARPLNVIPPSIKPQHKGMQTSPDKIFMTTDFPFANEEFKIISHDGASFVDGTNISNILVKISDDDSSPCCMISKDRSVSSPIKCIDADMCTIDFKLASYKEADDKDKIAHNFKRITKISGSNRLSTREYDGSLSENISSNDRIKNNSARHDKLDNISRSKKLSAVSYFDGSKWLALSSDETTSDEDYRIHVPQHIIIENETQVIQVSTQSVEPSTRCIETQTDEDIGHQYFHPTLDQFSQTQISSSVESNHDDIFDILRCTDDKKSQETNDPNLNHTNIKDDRNVLRRGSIKSVIAHEYGEMYSIFKEIPATLTLLKAKVVTSDQFNASEDLKEALERYPNLRTGTWSWDQRSSVGFGFILSPLGSESQHGRKIYDTADLANYEHGSASESISYRFEPTMELFTII